MTDSIKSRLILFAAPAPKTRQAALGCREDAKRHVVDRRFLRALHLKSARTKDHTSEEKQETAAGTYQKRA